MATTLIDSLDPGRPTPLPAARASRPLEVDGHYVLAELGSGGMAAVYEAAAPDGSRVALKVHTPLGLHSLGSDLAADAEARVLGRLDHANIPQLVDSGMTPDGTNWMSMTLVTGRTFRTVLQELEVCSPEARRAVLLDELLPQLIKIADALHHAHGHDVIHRDVKPGNILVSWAGVPSLIDWGLASTHGHGPGPLRASFVGPMRAADRGSGSGSDSIMGTAGYMAPEQIRGEEKSITPLSDVFGLGCVLYEAMTGERAFMGRGARSRMLATLTGDVIDPGLRAPQMKLSDELVAVCQRAMAPRPEDRFLSAQAFSTALAEAWMAARRAALRAERN